MSNDVKSLMESLRGFVVKKGNEITVRMHSGVKEKTPVDTGTAAEGWKIKKHIAQSGEHALITNDVDYIGWLNFGTPYMDGHFMVERTIQEVQRDYR